MEAGHALGLFKIFTLLLLYLEQEATPELFFVLLHLGALPFFRSVDDASPIQMSQHLCFVFTPKLPSLLSVFVFWKTTTAWHGIIRTQSNAYRIRTLLLKGWADRPSATHSLGFLWVSHTNQALLTNAAHE